MLEEEYRPVAAAWVVVGPNNDNQLFVRLQDPKVEFAVPQYPYTTQGTFISNVGGVVKVGYINEMNGVERIGSSEANRRYKDYVQIVDVTYLSNGYDTPSMYAGHATLKYAESILKAFNLPFHYKKYEGINGCIDYILLSDHYFAQDLVGTRYMSRDFGEVRVKKHYLTAYYTECYMIEQVECPRRIYHLDLKHYPEVHPAISMKQMFEDYKNKTGLLWPGE